MQQWIKDTAVLGTGLWLIGYLASLVLFFTPLPESWVDSFNHFHTGYYRGYVVVVPAAEGPPAGILCESRDSVGADRGCF